MPPAGRDRLSPREIVEDFANVSGGWFWETDAEHRFVYMSRSVEAVTGVPPEWHYGKTRRDFGIPKAVSKESFEEHLATLDRHEPFRDFVFQRQAPDGIKYMKTSGAPFYDANGGFLGYRGLATDITEQVTAERTVRLLSEAIEQMSDSFVLWDHQDRIAFCNRRFRELNAGLEHVAKVGAWFPDYVESVADHTFGHEPTAEKNEWIETRVRRHTEFTGPFELNRGANGWMLVREEALSNGAVVSFGTDITDQKARQGELDEARRQAELANEAKSQFLANMSHEIRTPLNGIIGLSRLLTGTPLNSGQHDYLRKIIVSSENLLAIINDILDFSKIEAGQLAIEETSFNLLDVVETASAMVAPRVADRGVEFVVKIDPNTPLDLVGDPLRIGQVLNNLCSNAAKFTSRGEIVVAIQATSVRDDRAVLEVLVRDTGIGMTKEQIGRIFKPFTQADVSTTRSFGGTGLGLSISKALVEAMGGRVWVESTADVGSTFGFSVDVGLNIGGVRRSIIMPDDLHGLRVLVVDDNETARIVISESMRAMGFLVDTAESGPEALELLSAGTTHDVVVLDWVMPGLDGVSTARAIVERAAGGRRPRLLLASGMPMEGASVDFRAAGIDAVVSKPLNQSILFDAIVNAFGRSEAVAYARGSQTAADAARLAGLRLLLAEDNEINQQVAVSILERAGVAVDVVSNGQLAVQRLFEVGPDHYDGVLMDIQMPVMDGLQATRAVKADIRFANLPIIAMTAHAMASERDKCLEAGMCGHVAKPVDDDKLYGVLATWCLAGGGAPRPSSGDEPVERQPSEAKPVSTGTTLDLHRVGSLNLEDLRSRLRDEKLAARLVQRFRAINQATPADLRRAISGGNETVARQIVHQLKGVLGSLGAQEAFAAAIRLEDALLGPADARSDLAERHDRFERALQRLFEEIDAATSDADCADGVGEVRDAAVDPARPSAGRVRELVELLRGGDMAAEALWTELRPAVLRADATLGGEVDRRIDSLDYEAAANALEEFAHTIENLGPRR